MSTHIESVVYISAHPNGNSQSIRDNISVTLMNMPKSPPLLYLMAVYT